MSRGTVFASLLVALLLNVVSTSAQTASFTHQGNLGFPGSGNFDFELKLYDTPTPGTGTQQGATIEQPNISVTNGDFTLQLDFGAAVFNGAELYLETGWRPAGGGTFTVLAPREKITAVYANRSLSAATADSATNATQLGGLPPTSFIQNTATQQQGVSFNIGGDGSVGGTLSAGTVNAATQFDLGGSRLLSADEGVYAMSLGFNTGNCNDCLIIGDYAGLSSTYTSGGGGNTFVGNFAGSTSNSTSGNSFFGQGAGHFDSTGSGNTMVGWSAGFYTGTGNLNVFVGSEAGTSNIGGSQNSTLGFAADLSDNLSNATAIGSFAFVGQSNSLVLGSIKGIHSASADTSVGIGTTTPSFRLHVIDPSNAGLRVQTNSTGGAVASFGGNGDFQIDAPGIVGGRFIVKENGFVGIGTSVPHDALEVDGKIRIAALGSSGTAQLCRNSLLQISLCSSSLRYKTNVAPFSGGLSLIDRLHPITFDWKSTGEPDLGLGAEDVAKVEPLLVTRNDKGEIEGVKYDRISVVLLNAVKEQQAQIKQQSERIQQQANQLKRQSQLINQQQAELAGLIRLVRHNHHHRLNIRTHSRKTS